MNNRLGPYLIDGQIGRGGMGIVYSAHHEDSAEKVAIKVLPGGFSTDEAFRVRFEAEIDALKHLNHPNIVQIYGFGEQDGELFYVMEFIEGRSLHDIIKHDGPLHWQDGRWAYRRTLKESGRRPCPSPARYHLATDPLQRTLPPRREPASG